MRIFCPGKAVEGLRGSVATLRRTSNPEDLRSQGEKAASLSRRGGSKASSPLPLLVRTNHQLSGKGKPVTTPLHSL